jgi:hypothetical protein
MNDSGWMSESSSPVGFARADLLQEALSDECR